MNSDYMQQFFDEGYEMLIEYAYQSPCDGWCSYYRFAFSSSGLEDKMSTIREEILECGGVLLDIKSTWVYSEIPF